MRVRIHRHTGIFVLFLFAFVLFTQCSITSFYKTDQSKNSTKHTVCCIKKEKPVNATVKPSNKSGKLQQFSTFCKTRISQKDFIFYYTFHKKTIHNSPRRENCYILLQAHWFT